MVQTSLVVVWTTENIEEYKRQNLWCFSLCSPWLIFVLSNHTYSPSHHKQSHDS